MKLRFLILPIFAAFPLCSVSCKDPELVKQEKEHKEASDELERAQKELNEAKKKELEETGSLSTDPKALDEIIEASKKMEESASGEDAKGMKVLRIFMESTQKDMAELAKYQEGLIQATDFSSLKSGDDIDKLSEKVKIYQKANNALAKKIQTGWQQSLQEDLKKEGLSEKSRNQFMVGFNSSMGAQKPHLLVIRQTDDEMCKAILEQHAILKKYLGKWQWDSKQGAPLFADNTALELFNAQAIKIQKASIRQTEAQKKIIQSQ